VGGLSNHHYKGSETKMASSPKSFSFANCPNDHTVYSPRTGADGASITPPLAFRVTAHHVVCEKCYYTQVRDRLRGKHDIQLVESRECQAEDYLRSLGTVTKVRFSSCNCRTQSAGWLFRLPVLCDGPRPAARRGGDTPLTPSGRSECPTQWARRGICAAWRTVASVRRVRVQGSHGRFQGVGH
jgi:hypothetical protein